MGIRTLVRSYISKRALASDWKQLIVSSSYSEVVYVVLGERLSAHALERGRWPDFADR